MTVELLQPVDRAFGSLDEWSQALRQTLFDAVSPSHLNEVLQHREALLAGGKMLRSRLVYRLCAASERTSGFALAAGATVELIHSASLLHDDVIDGGLLRRNEPAFWTERGTPGAILLGDLLVFRAMLLMMEQGDFSSVKDLVRLSGQVCETEAEQELILRGQPANWETVLRVAQGKTGALFAFAARAMATDEPGLAEALEQAGMDLGTAYQLADDLLDAAGTEADTGKTLGQDARRGKGTAAVAKGAPDQPEDYVLDLLNGSVRHLDPWPRVQEALSSYVQQDLLPLVRQQLAVEA